MQPIQGPQAAISSDPSASKLVVAKNSLVSRAFAGTPWEALAPCMKGMNALLFVKKEEVVGSAMGGVKSIVKKGKLEFNDFTGAVMDRKLYGHLDLKVLESMLSKLESDGMVLGSIYTPSLSYREGSDAVGGDGDANKVDVDTIKGPEAELPTKPVDSLSFDIELDKLQRTWRKYTNKQSNKDGDMNAILSNR